VSEIDVDIQELNADGDGVVRQRHLELVVPFTIPGERVRVQFDRTRTVATLLEVLDPAPFRMAPRCPHFGPCGGCAWQHIAYPEQLRLKTALVERLVRERVREAPRVRPTLSPHADESRGASRGPHADTADATPWGYRQKVHFVFANQGSGSGVRGSYRAQRSNAARRSGSPALIMGHYARGSRRVVPVRECPVHDERGNALAFHLASALDRAGVEAAAPASSPAARGRASSGVVRSVTIRVALHTSELMTTLVVRDDTDRALRTATRRALADAPAATSFHVNLHPKDNRFIFGTDTRSISGHARLRESVAGVSFLISPTAFFQTNVRAAELLVQLVRDAVPADAIVLDLYAGAGLFALPLARDGHLITAVEENRAAVADGEASQRLNQIPEERCRFLAQPVETALRRLPPCDVIVLDPPRSGCSDVVINELCDRRREPILVYVSCNPEALARDLGTMTGRGFRIGSIQPIDMFPHTAHVETVVVLTRG
jgi:23S rRNA (uracil1939-C5)-methyltransferase